MEIIFKVIAASPSNPPVVGDTDFKGHYSGVNINMLWSELSTPIRQATEKFVIPYIGNEWYDSIAGDYNAGTSMSPEQEKALELLQDCVAYFSAYHIIPERNAFLSSMGVTQNSPTEGSAAPVNQWGYKSLRWNALENGDAFLDKLLNYLEAQTLDGNPDFAQWATSSAFDAGTSNFFRRTDQLDQYLNIQKSRRSFLGLIKYLKEVEEDVIMPILCTDQFAALLEPETVLSDEELMLLTKVRKSVAFLGLQAAIPHHRIVIDGDGFRVVSQTDQFDDRRNQTNSIHESAITALLQRAERNGAKYLADLRNYLASNAATFTLWANSDCNNSPRKTGHSIVVSPDNIGGIGLF